MKTLSSKYILIAILFFFQVVVFAPPPPPGLPIDDNNEVFVVWALIFGIYIIYKYRSKRKPAA